MAEVVLGRQRSPEHETGRHMTLYLRAANVKDGRLDLSDVKEMNFTPAEQVVFALKPGDVLVTEGAGSLAAVGASAVWDGELGGVVCLQNTLLRLRPREGSDRRFLAWWCRHAYGSGLFASVAAGANIFHLSADRVRTLPTWIPTFRRQREIADFLDTETARIDALIEKKRRMSLLLDERFRAMVVEELFRAVPRWIRLGRLVHLLPGYAFPSVSFSIDESGVRLLRGINVGTGVIRWNEAVFLSTSFDVDVSRFFLSPATL